MGSWNAHDLERARADDIEPILGLRNAAARWLLGQGVDQWQVDQLPRAVVERRVAEGTAFVLRDDDSGALVATICLDWDDRHTWGARGADGSAGYVHTMVVSPDCVGCGLGRQLLRWAETEIVASGRTLSRLDCAEHNQTLRAWYRAAGYDEVGRHDYGDAWFSVTLFERQLPERR